MWTKTKIIALTAVLGIAAVMALAIPWDTLWKPVVIVGAWIGAGSWCVFAGGGSPWKL